MKKQKKIICHLPKINKKISPLLPWEYMEQTKSQSELIQRTKNENFDWLIISLGSQNYYKNFQILEETRLFPTKKIVYAEKKYTQNLKSIIEGFDAFIINQWELPTLNGTVNSQAAIKKDGEILIYFKSYAEQITIFSGQEEKNIKNKYPGVLINNYTEDELIDHLKQNRFKLIIDTSTATYPWAFFQPPTSSVIKTFKQINFTEIPLLVCLKNKINLKKEIINTIRYYFSQSKV